MPSKMVYIGLLILVAGSILALAGSTLSKETWKSKSSDLYDSVVTVRVGQKYRYVPYFWPLTMGETKDFTVKGNITEATGHQFNFYVFNVTNYESWLAKKLPYVSYIEVKNVTAYSFLVLPTKEDSSILRFVVEDRGAVDIETKLSAKMEWSEKQIIKPIIPGLFIFGESVGIIGFIIIVVAAVKTYFKREKKSQPAV